MAAYFLALLNTYIMRWFKGNSNVCKMLTCDIGLVISKSLIILFILFLMFTQWILCLPLSSNMKIYFFKFCISSALCKKLKPLASFFSEWKIFFVHDKYSSSPACPHAHYHPARLSFCVLYPDELSNSA